MPAAPIDPAQLAQLQSTLQDLILLCEGFDAASNQGKARMIRKQFDEMMDTGEAFQSMPFSENLTRIADVLQESEGEELTEEQKGSIKEEVQAIADELGIETQGSDSSSDSSQPPMPPPPGPRPGPPGPPGPPRP